MTWVRNDRLPIVSFPEPSRHDYETSSMIVTLHEFFVIVRFFYYHLNVIYDSLIGLT